MRQRGAALIVALLAVALATLLATRLLENTDATISFVEGRNWHAQAVELTRGGVDYARVILAEDSRRSAIDHGGEAWARPLPPVEAEGGRISGRIEDLQGRWNLNNLIGYSGKLDPLALACYRRLLQALDIDVRLADSLAAQLLPGSPGAAGDAAATIKARPLSDISGVLAAAGYGRGILEKLRPFVTVLPGVQPVNINTAPPLVIAALFPGMPLADAQRIVKRREQLPFRDQAEFRGELSSNLNADANNATFGVSSQFFLVRANAMVGRAVVRQQALVQRQSTGNWPVVLWRTYL